MRTLWYQKKIVEIRFLTLKHEKNLKKMLIKAKIPLFQFFSFTAQQRKWQHPCSQMWPIEQPYIELGPKVFQ